MPILKNSVGKVVEQKPRETDQELLKKLKLRYTVPDDASFLKATLQDPEVGRWFPMCTEQELDDSVRRWISFHRIKSSLTCEYEGVPCGLVTLYLQGYKKLLHQSEMGIMVGSGFRNRGIGSFLMQSVMRFAKEQFRIELLHLQVNAENPAIHLYQRFGFREFGRQSHWMKEPDRYVGRVFMERFL